MSHRFLYKAAKARVVTLLMSCSSGNYRRVNIGPFRYIMDVKFINDKSRPEFWRNQCILS